MWQIQVFGNIKKKTVKLSLGLIKHYAMRTYGGVKVELHYS
jgi:hypothetical protein